MRNKQQQNEGVNLTLKVELNIIEKFEKEIQERKRQSYFNAIQDKLSICNYQYRDTFEDENNKIIYFLLNDVSCESYALCIRRVDYSDDIRFVTELYFDEDCKIDYLIEIFNLVNEIVEVVKDEK